MRPKQKAQGKLHIAVLLALLVVLCYWNSFNSSFHYDDYDIVFDINWETPDYLLHTLRYMPQRFVLFGSFALNYQLNGYNVVGYHIFNVFVHAMNSILIFLIAVRLLGYDSNESSECASDRNILAAFGVGALFASSTALTQSVTYIQGRSSSLCTLFCLASFYCYSVAAGHPGNRAASGSMKGMLLPLSLSTLAFIFACMTKEIGVTLMAVLIVFEFIYVLKCQPKSLARHTIIRLLPFILIPAAALSYRILMYGAIGETRSIRDFWPNLFTQLSVIVTYLRMLLVPVGLTIDHDYPVYHSLAEPRVSASLALLCGLLLAAVASVRRLPTFAFGFFFFSIALLPTTLVPIWDVISEHWMYLPSVGYFLMVGALLRELFRRHEQSPGRRRMAMRAMLFAVFLYAAGTIARNTVWRNEFTLWSDAVQKSPNKERPHTNLAKALAEMGQMEAATDELRIALSIDPYSLEAHNNLGFIFMENGQYDRAIEQFQLTIAVYPDPFNAPPMEIMNVARAFFNMGVAYQQEGHPESALRAYENAVRVSPKLAEAYSNMGTVYLGIGKYEDAISSFEKALSVNPNLEFARKNLDMLAQGNARHDEAADQSPND